MKLGPIALKIRMADTRFGQRVAGIADLAMVNDKTLIDETAFVVQLSENAADNAIDSGINQLITERFAVVVALKNDTSQADKTGLTSYDALYEVRGQLFKALLGWQIPRGENDLDAESLIFYNGGRVLDFNQAWLWYQFEFAVTTRIQDEDGWDNDADSLSAFETAWAQYIINPDADFSMGGRSLPLDNSEVDAQQSIGDPGDELADTKVWRPVGSFVSPEVTFQCATEGATIYYTTDGTIPDETATEYTAPITIAQTTAFLVIAIKSGLEDSDILNFGAYVFSPRLLKTGQTTQYDSKEDDGYFEKGGDRSYTVNSIGDQSGTTDITVNGKTVTVSNNTVLDNATGLEWLRTPPASDIGPDSNGKLLWNDSVNSEDIFEFCDQANAEGLSGYTDWRVPNFTELFSLLVNEASEPSPRIDQTAFPSWPDSDWFWTSTARGSLANVRKFVIHFNSNLASGIPTSSKYYTTLVRGEG